MSTPTFLLQFFTFVRQEALLTNEGHHDAMHVRCYNGGFAIAGLPEEDIRVPRAPRRVNDGRLWKVKGVFRSIETLDKFKSPSMDYINSFEVFYSSPTKIRFKNLNSSILTFPYTLANDRTEVVVKASRGDSGGAEKPVADIAVSTGLDISNEGDA
ncbi:hypothetical protein BDN72DRAFT_906460 [Pluteus cervinus]|uniref:Uncharacterized protein n=1 Tax=Pluteus cervinus TaxID=181527 RepID=A0ACD3A1F3_9AGAR|nr:hypothetical protein BDN72DRAFT_906460 [Pluteus cervinus]